MDQLDIIELKQLLQDIKLYIERQEYHIIKNRIEEFEDDYLEILEGIN